MFGGLFNYDNPVWRAIGKFWDVLILNILWSVCCIPIFTIGASTTAMYYVTLKLVRDEDGYTFRSFFHSFKENFKQATIIWFLILVSGAVLGVDLWFVLGSGMVPAGNIRTMVAAVFIGILIIWVAVVTYVFPVLARFYGTVKRTIINAMFMSVRHILTTVGILVIDIAIVALTFTVLPFLVAFGVALIAYVNSFFINRVFQKYIPKDTRDIHDMRPIFADEEDASGTEAPSENAAGADETSL